MNLFLVGYMASGKTTFGSALASRLNLPFVDLDQYIEETEGKKISEIFNSHGEEGFRKIEKKCLLEICRNQNCIIACGGGTPCYFDNMEVMNDQGVTVFLKASVATLVRRLVEENASRPLVAGKSPDEIEDFVKRQLSLRQPFYSKAQIIFNSDFLDTEQEINQSIDCFLNANPFVFSKPFI